jgi:hypothetical protein
LQQVKIALLQLQALRWRPCAMQLANLLSYTSAKAMSASVSLWQSASQDFVTLFLWVQRSRCKPDLPRRF